MGKTSAIPPSQQQIALPADAQTFNTWQDCDDPQPYRIIFGGRRRVTDHKLTVSPSAVQWADGTVDDGRIEGPHIYVYDLDENPLNSGQARELAAALLASVAEVDRWAQR